jgi:hypothetical protein
MDEEDKKRLAKLVSVTMGKPLIVMVNMWLAEDQPLWLFRDVMTDAFWAHLIMKFSPHITCLKT